MNRPRSENEIDAIRLQADWGQADWGQADWRRRTGVRRTGAGGLGRADASKLVPNSDDLE